MVPGYICGGGGAVRQGARNGPIGAAIAGTGQRRRAPVLRGSPSMRNAA
jgi:hypothetical protein